jgi:site-specific recombinase XerD
MMPVQKRISLRSINTEIAILGALFNKAVEWGYINVSPFKKVKMFKTPARPPRFLSNEEINTFVDHSGRNIQNNGCYLALHRV